MTNTLDLEREAPNSAPDSQLFIRQLQDAFGRMPDNIHVYLFFQRGKEDVFVDANRQVLRAFRELTDKIIFREYYLDHELAAKWGVSDGPTLLIAPEKFRIRWVGAPMGEEARTLLETFLLVGSGKSGLSDQSRRVIEKIDSPRHIKVFVSPSCPYCPQEAINGVKAAIERPDLVSLDIIDIQARPDIAQQYSAFSVPMAYANEALIGQGAQSEEVFSLSLQKLEAQTIFIPDSDAEVVETDLLIVGGGPAGLSAAIYGERSGLNTAVIEADALGGQVATTPIVENYPGFTSVGGKSLVDIMVSHALQYCQIYQGERVIDIQKADKRFEVTTTRRKFYAGTILLATGASHRHLGVPGEKRLSGRGVSYCSTCDGPLFKGKKVVMVGGGNSAVTEALYLYHMGVEVTLVHRRDTLRAQEVLAKGLKDAGIPILWNTEVKEIRGKERVETVVIENNQTGESTTLDTNGVFIAIGYEPSVDLAKKIGVELNEDGYIKKDAKHRTSVPGVYSAGDVEGGYKQIVTATGQGAEAAMTIFEDIVNPYWHTE
jgi:thioredoxin reductase (NADPH)